MDYTTGFFLLVFLCCFSIVITSFREEGADLCASRAFVCLFVLYMFIFALCLFPLVSGWLGLRSWHSLDFSINFFVSDLMNMCNVLSYVTPWQ